VPHTEEYSAVWTTIVVVLTVVGIVATILAWFGGGENPNAER